MSHRGPVHALVLAGGIGSRLRPLTESVPKCLVDVHGRPLLEYWLDALARVPAEEVRVNTHHLAPTVRSYLRAADSRYRFRVVESHEPELLGSAGTVTANRDLADAAREVIVVYADNFSDIDLCALVQHHRGHGDPVTMALFHTPAPHSCGIADLDEAGRVIAFTEKPEQPTSDLANAGVYVFDADAYRDAADRNAFDVGFDLLPALVGRMRGFSWDGYHRDIGTPESLQQVRHDAARVLRRMEGASR